MIVLKSENLLHRFIEYSYHCLDGGYDPSPADEETFLKMIADFKKGTGLRVAGNPGVGKTLFFKILQRILHPQDKNYFLIVNCAELVKDFNIEGHIVFDRYNERNIVLNDLGAEDKGMHYGDRVEVIEKLIEKRYEDFYTHGRKTHITTNLTFEEIGARYFDRCKTRIAEITTFYTLAGDNKRPLKNFKEFPAVYYPIIKTEEEIAFEKKYAELKQWYIDNPPPEEPKREKIKIFCSCVTPVIDTVGMICVNCCEYIKEHHKPFAT